MENLQGGTLALEHHYHLDERLGSFGLVTLYAGTQDPFNLPVIITVYGGLLTAGANDTVTDRIKASAQLASHLEPEGLLSVADFGEIEQGVPFVIEETVPGSSLADEMESRGVFSPAEVTRLITRLTSLLQNAHGTGICHGNLKPEWVRLPEGNDALAGARLAHFGLGPSMSELVAMPQAVLTTDLVDAFPPESFDVAARDQIDDDDAPSPHLTPRADQWALAALAYRLLVGVHPFFDDPVDASEGILRIKTEEPPSLREMGIDEDLADVIDRALSPNPQDRWPDIQRFGRAFRQAVDGPEAVGEDSAQPDSDHSADALYDEPFDAETSSETDEIVGPRPSGYLLTAALVALVLSNLGWIFTNLNAEEPVADDVEVEDAQIDGPNTLPLGLQIRTTPSDAELFVLSDETETSIGFTPHVFTDSLLETTGLELKLSRSGYRDQYLAIEETDAGQNIEIELVADSTEEEDSGS